MSDKPEPKKTYRQEKPDKYDQKRGISTNHRNYWQQKVTTPTYLMLNPKTMQVHQDPHLAMKNYVRYKAA